MAEERVNELLRQYKESGDIAIRNQIAEKYLYIADILAKKFVGRGVEYDDLRQVAAFALLRGIDRFDPDMGRQFTTFITPTITGEIKNYFRDKSRMIKVPRRLSEMSAAIKSFSAQYEAKNGVKPSVKVIMESLALSEEDVVQALEIGGTLSLDSMAGGEENEEKSLYALLADGEDQYEAFEVKVESLALSEEDVVQALEIGGTLSLDSMAGGEENEEKSLYALLADGEDQYEAFEVKEALRAAMQDFSDTEKALIKYRYVEELSQSETSKRLGVSQMFVSRMERKLLLKLKEKLQDSI